MTNTQLFKVESVFYSVFDRLSSHFVTRHCAYSACKSFCEFARHSSLAYYEYNDYLIVPESFYPIDLDSSLGEVLSDISQLPHVDVSFSDLGENRYSFSFSINIFS